MIGQVTPCSRSALIQFDEKKVIFKRVFDETATGDDFELISAAAGEIIADFPDGYLEEIVQKVRPPGKVHL